MAHQLVGQRSTHSFEKERIVRVLQHRAVSLLLDVLEIFSRCSARRVFLAHVAEASRALSELLAIGAVAKPVDAEMLGLDERWASEKTEAGLGVDQRIRG